MNYLEKGKLLLGYQFSFRSGLGAADFLTVLSHERLRTRNSRGTVRVLAIAVDIAGVFDKVSNFGVLHKLKSYGVSGELHCWLTNCNYISIPCTKEAARHS